VYLKKYIPCISLARQFDEFVQGARKMSEDRNCGCGRSPTGLCIGWHSLGEDEYKKALEEWKARENQKD
jgi:hypothetical protein